MDEDRLANGLGWFSLGLGLAQVAAPRSLSRMIGVEDTSGSRTVMRSVGVRELTSGAGILGQPMPVGWVWGRVAGDAMDLTLLGAELTSDTTERDRVTMALASVVGVTILDVMCALQYRRRVAGLDARMSNNHGKEVKKSVTVNRPQEEVYRFWHDFRNLPRFARHLVSVQVTGDRRSHWKAKAPAGMTVEWDAEVVTDRPNELIAWRSLPGAAVENAGAVRFVRAPGGRGTEVHVELQYNPPGGTIGATVAKLLGEEPGRQVEDDLRAFKEVLETGEVIQSEASAKHGGPAQPPAMVPQR
ncbi:MAG: hypothetical protein JWO42_33 [Chloroflexi bacterium]|nr:hypothetical protein [Chloroflexota bacterium]